jgi:hypothetical protein
MGEPWGRRLWFALAAVVVAASGLQLYGLTTWPMADDEVPSLVELGLLDVGAETFSVPAGQVGRLPRTVPVWYGLQGLAIQVLPAGPIGYRAPSVLWGVLASAAAFFFAARWRGLWFAVALAIVMNLSQIFVYLAQLNRFYSLPLLLQVLTFGAIWAPRGGLGMLAVVGALSALAMLSHNVTLVPFVLAFIAAVATHVLCGIPRHVVWRTGAAALVSLLLYVFYVRPLIEGWHNTGNPTPVLISFAAHAGVPALALSLFGAWLAVFRRDSGSAGVWWALMSAGGIAVLLTAPINWNPRYFLFLMPPVWVLAATAVAFVVQGVSAANRAVWYVTVALLFLPGLLSHYQDGSRHDYRAAAEVLVARVQSGQSILSDDAETISYYLPPDLREYLFVRTKVTNLPSSEFFLVVRSNAWMPQPAIRGRSVAVIAEISRRRFDQFSHVLRVYRVAPRESQ